MIPVLVPPFIGSGVQFNPLTLITGNGGFWRADSGVSVSSGSVTSWTDQSTFGNNLTSVTSAPGVPPQWSSTTWLGTKPGVSFIGTNNSAVWGLFPFPATTGSVFSLYYVASGNAFFNTMLGIDVATLNNTVMIRLDTSNTKIQSNHGAINCESTTTYSSGTAYLTGSVLDGANLTQWFNGSTGASTADTGTIGGTTGSGFPELIIGCQPITYNVSGNFHNFTGNVAFVGLTQKVMTSTDWTNLKNWCNSNWGTAF
jgi:hypothetical protein